MKEHRLHKRIDSEEICFLELNDGYYPATVKNISSGGALVHTYNPLSGLHVGENCFVGMYGEPPREYPCKVARVDIYNVALKFTGRYIFKRADEVSR
jgi:hypothetical protein